MKTPISQKTKRNNEKAFNNHFLANEQVYKQNKKKRKPGGGRKLKYNEPVKLETFKCPESKVKEFRKEVNNILKSYLPNKQ